VWFLPKYRTIKHDWRKLMNYPAYETIPETHYNTVIEQNTQPTQATRGISTLRDFYNLHAESENHAYHALPAYWILFIFGVWHTSL